MISNISHDGEPPSESEWLIYQAKVELPSDPRVKWLLIAVRWVLPVLVMIGGLVVMSLGGESNLESGASIMGAGPAIWAINWLYRAAVDGDRDREREDAARDFLSVNGHWPDEAPR